MNASRSTAVDPLPSLNLDIVLRDPNWPSGVVARSFLDRIAATISSMVDVEKGTLAVVAFSSDMDVKRLNSRYRGIDKPTNVLAFCAPAQVAGNDELDTTPFAVIGDIILARETVMLEAEGLSSCSARSMEHHTAHLIVHGILHLLGYDHDQEPDAEEMEALEIDILAKLGIANPYTEELNDEG